MVLAAVGKRLGVVKAAGAFSIVSSFRASPLFQAEARRCHIFPRAVSLPPSRLTHGEILFFSELSIIYAVHEQKRRNSQEAVLKMN